MKVLNIHRRLVRGSRRDLGALIDSLGSPADRLWPRRNWPRLVLDRPLAVGAVGGHGPIGYVVDAYAPGNSVRCRFTAPKGFHGWHGFAVLDAAAGFCTLEHRLEMTTQGLARLSWPLLYGRLHDALIEDALSQAQVALGHEPDAVAWTAVVRVLRRLARRRSTHRPSIDRGTHAG